jgi:hypothetical protein
LEDSFNRNCSVQYASRLSGGATVGDTMLEELMQTGESEMERILRLRGYL